MLIQDTSWSAFLKHYYLAFVWMLLALILLALVATTQSAVFAAPMVIIAIFKATRWGISFSVLRSDVKTDDTGCLMSIIGLIFFIAFWPFMETLRQFAFLSRARRLWTKGEIIVNERTNAPIRSA
ncbi:MAG: hypothetical protein SFZ02_18930 [bacterium]|nr:hypothetical protein [bacterium]